MTSVFLSYARKDDELFVRRLYDDLSAAGFDVWFDRVSMPGRGLTFTQEIGRAIDARDRLVLVLGPKAVQSEYVEREWRYAFDAGKVINPILRLGDYGLLHAELKLIDTPDFRDDTRYPEQLATLIRQLSEPVAPLGKLIAVPSLPPHFLLRRDRLEALKNAVISDLQRLVGVTGTTTRVGVHGMGGIGKSVLTSALARSPEVRRAFPDGVIWVPIGERPDLLVRQREVARFFGHRDNIETVHEGRSVLQGLLHDRAVLLVLDDVWHKDAAEAFDVLGSRCRLVVTTRDATLIAGLGGVEQQVQVLTDAEARQLLAEWANVRATPCATPTSASCGMIWCESAKRGVSP